MEAFETFEHAGVTVEIHQDYDAGNPFEQFEQLAELVWTEREHANRNVNGRVELDHEHYLDPDRFSSTAHMQRYLTLMEGYLVAVPFHLADYGSSGHSATVRDEYADMNRVSGFLVVSEKNREKVGAPLDGLEENAMSDWREWKAWVEGNVFGYVVKAGADHDSVWGFYGDLDYVRKEAKEVAEGMASERRRLRSLPWLPTFGNPILTSERG
jgi:hypothetical protein